MSWKIISAVAIAALAAAAFLLFSAGMTGTVDDKGKGSYTILSPDDFARLVESGGAFVLQVHTPYYGEIDGTDMVREDWTDVDAYVKELPKDRPIAIYCRSGRMSGIVGRELARRGFVVYDLAGGMNAWERSGRGLVYRQ